ncbi:fasciclin-2 isoform X2 [Phymastichus coffea]|uniref:fasciclin-2 isoform X2 n=1 Tax=Phymastichus coffea TaxID=108790 RepID=UPI00273BD3AF|nr:fasciclin-2 isoform X2 [Phymastichus coffea]
MEARRCRPAAAALLLLSLFALTAAQDYQKNSLEILPAGEVQTKAIGSKILLTCKPKVADSRLISEIQWIDPYNRVIDSLSMSPGYSKPMMYTEVHPDNSISLFFNNLNEEQAGKYICKAKYANNELLTKHVTIETIVALTWVDAPENQYPILGKEFKIKCEVRARPAPTVDWIFRDENIKTNDHYVIETHALKIKSVKLDDEGVYTCRASVTDTGELEERAIRVEVHVLPKIEEFQDTVVEVIEGETANIVCKGQGKPAPKYTWVKSLTKENLATADRFGVNEDTGALTISNVLREDTGEYQCTATNLAGSDTMNIQVNVIVKPKIMEFLNQTMPQLNQVTMGCRAFGRPPPSITFRKHTSEKPFLIGGQPGDDRIKLVNKVDDQKGETLAELTIDSVHREDDGLYECIANNKGGMAFKNGHLTVEFPPSFASMSNRTIWSWDARPVNLTCIAESIPNATIRWTYYGERHVEGDPYIQVIGNVAISTLQIKPIDRRYYTSYLCIATNPHGERTHRMELREAPKPADVPQVTMTEATATTMAFSIVPPTAPDDLPIRTITVQYRKQETPWDFARNRTWTVGSQTGYVVENLEPQTNYEFRFAASNDAGRGHWAMNKVFTTTMRNVPGLVRFYPLPDESGYVKGDLANRYWLKWSAAPDNGERVLSYLVRWCEVKRYSGNQFVVQDSSCSSSTETTARDYWIEHLSPDTYYRAEVRARNILGDGPVANVTFRTNRGNTHAAMLPPKSIDSLVIILTVVAVLVVILLIMDGVLFCVCKSGMIYYLRERSRRKPVDEEDAKLGSLYGWRFPLPYCDQKMANVAGVTAIQESGSGKSTITLVKHTAIDEKEPLKEEKKITPIIDSGLPRDTSVHFDGKNSISKTGFVAKDSAV